MKKLFYIQKLVQCFSVLLKDSIFIFCIILNLQKNTYRTKKTLPQTVLFAC